MGVHEDEIATLREMLAAHEQSSRELWRQRETLREKHDALLYQYKACHDEKDALREENARLKAQLAALVSALERTRHNLSLSINGRPVRDLAETYAEVDAALTNKG